MRPPRIGSRAYFRGCVDCLGSRLAESSKNHQPNAASTSFVAEMQPSLLPLPGTHRAPVSWMWPIVCTGFFVQICEQHLRLWLLLGELPPPGLKSCFALFADIAVHWSHPTQDHHFAALLPLRHITCSSPPCTFCDIGRPVLAPYNSRLGGSQVRRPNWSAVSKGI